MIFIKIYLLYGRKIRHFCVRFDNSGLYETLVYYLYDYVLFLQIPNKPREIRT